ncbi:hypothetical protein LCGC14_2629630, partial [marine sediment metagenome]
MAFISHQNIESAIQDCLKYHGREGKIS